MADPLAGPGTGGLWQHAQHLRRFRVFTDLTHPFAPSQARFPTLPDEVRTTLKTNRDHNSLIHRQGDLSVERNVLPKDCHPPGA